MTQKKPQMLGHAELTTVERSHCILVLRTETTSVIVLVLLLSGPSLPVPVELVSGDVFIVAPECVDAPEC